VVNPKVLDPPIRRVCDELELFRLLNSDQVACTLIVTTSATVSGRIPEQAWGKEEEEDSTVDLSLSEGREFPES
jgi:hypothetical protein